MLKTLTIAALSLAAVAMMTPAQAGWQNGGAINGIEPNGQFVNGVDPNGKCVNGLYPNGIELNGGGENGREINGTSTSAAGGIALERITLPDGRAAEAAR
jgi:hypothetical protein